MFYNMFSNNAHTLFYVCNREMLIRQESSPVFNHKFHGFHKFHRLVFTLMDANRPLIFD